MICPNCGFKNGDVKFCENCGNNLNMDIYQSEDNITKNMNVEKSKKQKRIFNKKIMFFVLILIIIIFALLFIFNKNDKYIDDDEIPNDELMADIIFDENGIPKFIDGTFTERIVKDSESVLLALNDIKDLMKINDVNKEFEVLNVSNSENITFYKLQQKYNGIDVYGEQLIIAVDNDGNVLSLSGEYIPNITVDSKNELTDEEIMNKLIAKYDADIEIMSKDKMIYDNNGIQQYVYIINLLTKEKMLKAIVNLENGVVVSEENLLIGSNYSYTGEGIDDNTYTINLYEIDDMLSMLQFDLTPYSSYLVKSITHLFFDSDRNIVMSDATMDGLDLYGIIMTSFGSKTSPIAVTIENGSIQYRENNYNQDTFVSDLVDATIYNKQKLYKCAVVTMKYFENIYDYYKNVLGRDSYDDNGSRIVVNVGFQDKSLSLISADLNNAFWFRLNHQMYIGFYEGYYLGQELDVLAHEFTHGVIEYTANFTDSKDKNKPNESGALNEAYADILGSLIEGEDWIIADGLNADCIRNLSNPTAKKNPNKIGGEYYYPDYYLNGRTIDQFLSDNDFENLYDYDSGGVHRNSTIPSYAAYLMYHNGAFKDREEMAKVWYNSLMFLNPYAKFEDCAYAVLTSARLLGLSQESLLIIEQAFVDTNMLEQKYFVFSGHVTDEQGNDLRGVKVTAVNKKNSSAIYTTYTTEDGLYTFNKLPKGDYDISYSKSRYSSEDKEVSLLKDSVLDLSLSKIDDSDISKAYCNPKKEICVIVTMYQISADSNGNMGETADKFYYKKGKKLDDMGLFNSDGYYDLGEFSDLVKPGWYYRGTDKVYNWDEPVNEDLELEMKIAGLGNQDIIDFSNIFNH